MDHKLFDQLDLAELIKLTYALDSEGEGISIDNRDRHRFFSVNVDSETVLIDSESNALYIPIDDITIRINSEGLMVAAGVEAGKAIELVDSEGDGIQTINVLVDSETVFINSENRLEVRFDKYLDNQAVFNASTFIPRKGLLLTEKDTGFLKVGNGVDTYDKLEYVLIELTKQDIDEIIF